MACGRGSEESAGASADLSSNPTLAPVASVAAAASGPAYSQQSDAAIVAGKSQLLAAWTEVHLATRRSSVVAVRIGSDGALLDAKSIALGSGDDASIALAFDGTDYLAVWSHKTASGSVISGVRIGADGKVKDAQPFTLGRASGSAKTPAVAYAAGGYLVTWSDDRDAGATADSYVTEVYGARISTAGAVVGSSEGFRITNAPGPLDGKLQVAAAGSTFLVGYAKRTAAATVPHAVRVSDAGAILDATPLAFGEGGSAPSVATDGTQFFVAWNDLALNRLAGARVSKDGAKIDANAIDIGAPQPDAPAVAWDGEAFSVASAKATQRVGANGTLLGGPLAGGSAVAGAGSSLFVIQNVGADASRGLAARVSGSLLPKAGGAATKSDITLARGAAALQKSVATAAHGTSSLSVWLEYEDIARPKLVGAVYVNGSATPVTIDPGTGAKNGAPSVAFDGTTYVVAWPQSATTSSVVHVNDTGVVIDTPKSYAGTLPQLSAGASGKVLLTTRAATGSSAWLLGTTDKEIALTPEPAGWTTSPLGKPVWDGNRYVLAWSATKGDGNAEIHAQRYDKNGAPMDVPAVKIASFPVGGAAELPRPTLATNGADTLIAFASPTTHQILGARLSPTGLSDAIPVRLDVGSSGFAFEPRLAWDGAQWTLAYERRSDAAAPDLGGYALELARIRPTASGLDTTAPVQAIAPRGLLPAIAAGANGISFLGYESIGTDDVAAPRVSLTQFTDVTTPPVNPGSSSSGGATAPGDDDDDSSPVAPAGDDDDDAPKKPSGPKPPATKGATVKAATSSSGGDAGDDGGGCSTSGTSRGSASSPLVLLALALVGRRLARRTRVPHARR